MGILDWDNDGKIEPHEIGGTSLIAGMLNNLADGDGSGNNNDRSSGGNGNDGGPGSSGGGGGRSGNSEGISGGSGGNGDGISCGCLMALILFPVIVFLALTIFR